VPPAEASIKVPAWLNDVRVYHNRGNSDFWGESSLHGDFVGLDDLLTENPRVVQGFIDIYGAWIEKYRIDGFRIDTARHVNPEFWQSFAPAMLNRARSLGIPHFHVFGEVAADGVDVAQLARHTRVDKLPSVLDFGFAGAVQQVLARDAGTSVLARLYQDDGLYEGGANATLRLPTFHGNHDFGRLAWIIREAKPAVGDEELAQRVMLANAMLFLLRGVPVVYYGDEQGFIGHGVDQASRQDMFASQVASYNDQNLLGSDRTTAVENFNPQHPFYAQIAGLAKMRQEYPVLRRGRQLVRAHGKTPGLFAVSRMGNDGREMLIAFNTSTHALVSQVEVEPTSLVFKTLRGPCSAKASAPGSVSVKLLPLSYVVCVGSAR
jgi:neopullulanase